MPKPIQKPHPPMWMACSSPDSFNIAANNGLGVLCFNIARADTLEARLRDYRAAIKAPKNQVTAKVNNQIAAFLMTLCGENNDQTINMAGEGMQWYMSLLKGQAPYWQHLHEQNRSEVFAQIESYKYAAQRAPEAFFFGKKQAEEKKEKDQLTPQALVDSGLLCAGNPDSCIKVLERFANLGVDLILCFMEMGRVPHAKTMESIKMFGKYVIPYFKGRSDWRYEQKPHAAH
jgi:alkanesulfonate monooxygenase SsuD/methylene tetrahydromethanopterin reductase-like flavin-dependent oxidoreductase (luciferase family)